MRSQIEQLKAEIDQLELVLFKLEAEVLDLERELDDFTAQYDRVIQPLVDRLDIVKGAIEELENPPAPPAGNAPADFGWTPPPGYRSVEEQFRETWKKPAADDSTPRLESSWTPDRDYVPVEEQFRRTWRRPPKDKKSSDSSTTGKTYMPSGSLSPDELKRIYRQLVRRYHPDLTTDPAERERRNTLMADINAAYSQQDADALQALANQPDEVSLDQPLAAMQLRQLRQVRDQLTRRIAQLRLNRTELMHSDLMELKIKASLAARENRDLLREMAAQLEQEYSACLRRLDELRGW